MRGKKKEKMEKFKNHVLNRVVEEMKKQGLNKRAFAKKMGKSETWLHNKLHDRSKLTFRDLERMATALNISQIELFPSQVKYNIDKMSLIDLIGKITEEKIEKVLKDNNIIKK